MLRMHKKPLIVSLVLLFVIINVAVIAYLFFIGQNNVPKTSPVSNSPITSPDSPMQPENKPVETKYMGAVTNIADSFSVKVPNGWSASISTTPSFVAIMFSRPNNLGSLVYAADSLPSIDRSGIAAWNGLTEHFFILAPKANLRFNPADHQEVSSEPFVFDDGHNGQKFYVVKRAAEAQKWGGLQKDSEWEGRTYIYEKGDDRIEAHLALYPSTDIDVAFFEKVIRTIVPNLS